MSVAVEDAETLFSEVGQVQKELEKFDIQKVIDANEIYELLEAHFFRTDRVQFVISRLLFNLGLRDNYDIDEDIIDLSDESSDEGELENFNYTSSPEYNIPSESVLLDSSLSNCGESFSFGISKEAKTNKANCAEETTKSGVNLLSTSSLLENNTSSGKNENAYEVSHTEIAASSITDTSSVLDPSLEYNRLCVGKTDLTSSLYAPPTPFQSEDFVCDVNNNDPNNNTEYDSTMQTVSYPEEQNDVRDNEDSAMGFEDQDDVRCKLLEEARLIHRIVPRQNLEQIYSFLEANLDHKNRVQIVMQEFLRMELSTEENNSATDNHVDSSSKDKEALAECQLHTAERKIKVDQQNISESQSCSSSNVKQVECMEIEAGPSTSQDQIKLEIGPSASRIAQANFLERDDVTAQVLNSDAAVSFRENSTEILGQPSVLNALSNSVPTTSKQPDSGEVSSTSYAEETSGELGVTSTTSLQKDIPLAPSNFNHQKTENIAETVASLHKTIEESQPSSSAEVNAPVLQHVVVEDRNKRKSESSDESSPSKKSKVADLNNIQEHPVVLSQEQQKFRSRLMEIFPDADPQYLRQQCQNIVTEESLLNMVTQLLENNDYPRRQNTEDISSEPMPGPSKSTSKEEEIETQYQTLLSILPNADPMYLRENCEKIGNNEDAMKAFVTNALEKKDYPTREDYLKRQEALALQKKYTEQFSIEGFLEVIPDPFKYFMIEKKNDHKVSHHSLAYLRGRYRRIRIQDMQRTLRKNGYNITKTCLDLDNFKGVLRKHRRSEYECRIPTEVNIPFLQEVAFIKNKRKIEDHIKEKAEKKKKAYEDAKLKGELLECGCCFDNEVMLEDMAACNEGHLFCKECVLKGAEVQIGNGRTTFPCLNDCEAEFSLKTLQTVLKPTVLSKMLQRKQLEEVKAAGIEDLETCPFCDFATIPAHEDKVFRCLNAECMRESCRTCKEPNHIPLRCDEVEKTAEVKLRTYIENRMTDALVRTCWKCAKKFIKEDGCNKMACTCGALMCYICRQPVKDYSHFNGQGGSDTHKCPLYSNNDAIHVDAVREEARKAKQEIESQNPELKLKHDPTQILPELRGTRTHRAPQLPPNLHRNLNRRIQHQQQVHQHYVYVGHDRPDMVAAYAEINRDIEMAVRVLAGRLEAPHAGFPVQLPPPVIHPLQNPPIFHVQHPIPARLQRNVAGHVYAVHVAQGQQRVHHLPPPPPPPQAPARAQLPMPLPHNRRPAQSPPDIPQLARP